MFEPCLNLRTLSSLFKESNSTPSKYEEKKNGLLPLVESFVLIELHLLTLFISKEPPRLEISVSTVEKLISDQFPQWAHLPVRPVEKSGWDHRTFHLGDEMSVRLPNAERYLHQVKKEQEWLPQLAPQLSVAIPQPLAFGEPSKDYPWNWSIYKWIEEESAENLEREKLNPFANDIAHFLLELHQVDMSVLDFSVEWTKSHHKMY